MARIHSRGPLKGRGWGRNRNWCFCGKDGEAGTDRQFLGGRVDPVLDLSASEAAP